MRRDSVRHSVWSVRCAAARNSSGGIIYHASERATLHSAGFESKPNPPFYSFRSFVQDRFCLSAANKAAQ